MCFGAFLSDFGEIWANMGLFGPFRAAGWGGAGFVGRVRVRGGFILLGGFSGALLVVSILGIVYDCHLQPLLQS